MLQLELFASSTDGRSLQPSPYLPIPEPSPLAPGAIAAHGVELYWVKGKGFWYFRYWHKEGGKLRRRHIPGGNSSSGIARARAESVKSAILEGQTPRQVLALIRSFSAPRRKRQPDRAN